MTTKKPADQQPADQQPHAVMPDDDDQATEAAQARTHDLLRPVHEERLLTRARREGELVEAEQERAVLADRFRPLRVQFPDEAIGYLPKAGLKLAYVGHAEVTNRLLEVDPLWNWEPVGFTAAGLPALDADGGLWIRLTVLGVTRLGYGHDDGKLGADSTKKAVSDALRNAAMRFGVALDLWSKSDRALLDAGHGVDAGDESGKAPRLTREQREAQQRLAAWNNGPRALWEQRVHELIGDRESLTAVWYDAGDLLAAPVTNRQSGEEVLLKDLITWAGQQPKPEPPGVLSGDQVDQAMFTAGQEQGA